MSTAAAPASIARPQVRLTQNLINGQWVDAADGKTFNTYNPSTGEVIAEVPHSSAEDVDRAVKAARAAFESGPWPKMSAREYGNLLFKLADLIEENKEELAALEVLNNGKPISEVMAADLPLVISTYRYFAGWADKVYGDTIPVDRAMGRFFTYTRKEPIGVAGQIIPWNFPLLMQCWKWSAALATGNTVVLKPAEQTPLSALRVAELAMEAGYPDGVINVVQGLGDTGAAITEHPGVDKIAFTGHYETAQKIMASASKTLKRITFELGGKSPNIVFADADIDTAVQGAMAGIFFNQGEVCCAGSRLFVEEAVHAEFVDRFKQMAESRRIGDPFDPATEQGAQISQEQFDKIMGYIESGKKEGAQCITGGERVGDKGWFIKPTIFDHVNNDMRIARDEIFGPVVTVLPFTDHKQLIAQANDTVYGLAAAVWTRDITKAFNIANNVKAGTVWVNCYNTFDAGAPFGGYKFSGQGRECGRDALNNYLETKTVWVNLGDE
ncbi:aldehyde dehydrogenase family protein [Planctomycetales bacterium ZRK34]|nr:aldehyde dehydrogenase family protein [Planctomycetales bacterium ZRK34]